ncbi:MAG: PAS domain S-box protein [Pseudomonadales bacterium]|nr:PAS domain S-box protein [Pseudomonadales bacterium]
MDEIPATGYEGVASCHLFRWIFDLCSEHHIDVQRVVKHVPYPREYLRNPAGFIAWDAFLTLMSNLGNYFSESQLQEAGERVFEHADQRIHRVVGRQLADPRAHYDLLFGPLGVLPRLYPATTEISEKAPGHLVMTLEMNAGLAPCRVFQAILAGELAAVPGSGASPGAEVSFRHTETGAVYDIWYARTSILRWLGRFTPKLPGTRRRERDLALSHENLMQVYDELREQTTARRDNERRAEALEGRYAFLEENIKDAIWIVDEDLTLRYASDSIRNLAGYVPAELKGNSVSEILSSTSFEDLQERFIEQRSGNDEATPSMIEAELVHKDGRIVWAEVRSRLLRDEKGNARLVCVAHDISERKDFETNLREREESYEAITTTAQDAIITVDADNTIRFANPAALRIFGMPSLEGLSLTQLMPDAPSGVSPPQPGQSGTLALTGIRGGGEKIDVEASLAPHTLGGEVYITWIIRDVTFRYRIEAERKTLEQQLQAAQRMDSIGQLTGGIAHDFNNLLVAINGYADLGLTDVVSDAERKQYLMEIRRASERAADMTHKLLAFSRRQIIEPEIVDVNELIKGIERIIERLLPDSIDVRFIQTLQDATIVADAGQIEQVVINLAVNARDAMKDGGKLVIAVDRRSVVDDEPGHSYRVPGEYVVVHVEDSGTGMSEDVKKKIFEPFFTTKPEGEGTGLGMSVVFGIVKQHNGFIELDSTPGAGTRFDIYLPSAESDSSIPTRESRTESQTEGGHETILLVEDNKHARDLARLILSGAGYDVVEAGDGVEALDVYDRRKDDIDLIIMDVVMPKLGGREVMNRIRESKPDAKVLFTSGYSSGGIHTNFILEEGLEFIPKPYGADTLKRKVRSLLGD